MKNLGWSLITFSATMFISTGLHHFNAGVDATFAIGMCWMGIVLFLSRLGTP